MGTLAQHTTINKTLNGKAVSFRGRGWWSLETITIDNEYIVYKKRSAIFAPMFTFTIPRQSVKNIEYIDSLSGSLLKITTLSNNNIISKSFSKTSIKRIKELLHK